MTHLALPRTDRSARTRCPGHLTTPLLVGTLSVLVGFGACSNSKARTGRVATPGSAASVGDRVAIRHNLLGYSPGRPKTVVVMSDTALHDVPFRVLRGGALVLEGKVSSSGPGNRGQAGYSHNAHVDLSGLTEPSTYVLDISAGHASQAAQAEIKIMADPYTEMATALLSHLRVARSGSADARLHPLSHAGDARARIHRSAGDRNHPGKWTPTDQTVDALGGWYDAGDYIKFTSTNALAAYYLLRAYELAPNLHDRRELSQTKWIDILDEAKHGLDYLTKLLPNEHDFIVQVGSKLDHEQPQRLPNEDTLDGQREAFCAPQPQTMALAVAALAVGARVFAAQGAPELAAEYGERAKALAMRAGRPDVLDFVAYDEEWFYPDQSVEDNQALGAIELYHLTRDEGALQAARAAGNKAGAGGYASWETLHLDANYRLEAHDPAAAARVDADLQGFTAFAQTNAWRVPMGPVWGGLYNYFPIGAVAAQRATTTQGVADTALLAYDALDYTLGRNRWGVSFFASPDIPGAVRHFYSQIYRITGAFPLGAVSEGPLGAKDHEEQMQHFADAQAIADLVVASEFNTKDEVFVDHDRNYATMETTIYGQAGALYLISALHRLENH